MDEVVRQSRRPHRPMTKTRRARLGGLTVVATHGPDHMTTIGRVGQTKLDDRIAREAGIPADAPDYAARLKAARSAHFIRLAERRWSQTKAAG